MANHVPLVVLVQQSRNGHFAQMVGSIHISDTKPFGYLFDRESRILLKQIKYLQPSVIGKALDDPLQPPILAGFSHTSSLLQYFAKY